MKTTIYYFTGTGNSLKVAKEIACGLEDAELVQISRNSIEVENNTDSMRIGIVFPVYYYGLPILVKEFTERLSVSSKAYIFAIATCGGSVGIAIKQLEKILEAKGAVISAAFKILMPDNYQVMYAPTPQEKRKVRFCLQNRKVGQIIQTVSKSETVKMEAEGELLPKTFGGLIYGYFKPKNWDRNFWVDSKCSGCSICARICPANNIVMEKGRPKWLHQCEHCLGCMQWCPKHAIQYKKGTVKRERYSNPYIKVHELYQNRETNK